MKKFVIGYFNNDKGLTLIELLLALTVTSIVIVVIFPIFTNGIKNYLAVNAEVELRNEADYIVGTLLNEIYLFYPDTIEQVDDTKIILRRSYSDNSEEDDDSLTRYIVKDGIIRSPESVKTDTLTFEIKNNQLYKIISSDDEDQEIQINNSRIKIITNNIEDETTEDEETETIEENNDENFGNSKINLLDCPKERPCQNGTLQVTLVLDFTDGSIQNKRNKPLKLESTFGF